MVFEHLVGAVQVGTAGPIKKEATVQIHKNKSLAQPIGLALFVFFGAFVLSAFASHSFTPVGDSSALDSEVNVEIEPSLSLAIMDKDPTSASDAVAIDTMSMEVTPNASGVFINSTAYVVAGSNNETGYTLSFSDTDDNTALINTDPTVTTNIPSISSASSSLTDITTNQWGYAFGDSTANSSGLSSNTLATSFNPIPALSSPITLASTTIPASNVYPFTAASKIDMNVPAGTYQDSVVFSLVANFVPKTDIVFNANQASYNPSTAVSGTMNGVDLDYNKKVVLPTNEYTRLGHRFLGWDEDSTATTPAYNDGDTIDYHTVNGSNTTSSTLTLYAIWQPKNFPTTLTTMQGMTSDICADVYTPTANSTTIEALDQTNGSNYYYSADNVAQSTLSDIRDSNTYVVRKLADGNCWMVQNLRLGSTARDITISSTDSDMYSGYTFSIPASAVQTSGTTDWSTDYHAVHVYNNGERWVEPTAERYAAIHTSGTPSNATQYIGNYYNWYTATAGSGLSSYANPTIGDAAFSICPKGWMLPSGGPGSDYSKLINIATGVVESANVPATTTYKIGSTPYNFSLFGVYKQGTTYANTGAGVSDWWTKTGIADNRVWVLSIITTWLGVVSGGDTQRHLGYSVRCLAR